MNWDFVARRKTTTFDPQQTFVGGVFFGAVGKEVFVIMRLLARRGLIEYEQHEAGTRLTITPKGYVFADRIRLGLSEDRKAFLVCRFTPGQDVIYEEVYRGFGLDPDVKCSILRVSDTEHVERIDDKIVQDLMEATIVVVDLSDDNFNVAFEAGFALATGKPIIWTKANDGKDLKLPFDIQSQNIMLYDRDNLPEFRKKLKHRLLAALSKAESSGIPLIGKKTVVQLRSDLSDSTSSP